MGDLLGVGTLFGSLISGVLGYVGQRESTAEQTSTAKEIAQMNIDYQNQYNQTVWNREDEYNQTIWAREDEYNAIEREREDTAYQRAVSDATAAGLSPLAVTGAASTGAATVSGNTGVSGNTTAPQSIDYSHLKQSEIASMAAGFASSIETMQALANIKQTQAETDYTEARTGDVGYQQKLSTEDLKLRLDQFEHLKETDKQKFVQFYDGLSQEARLTLEQLALAKQLASEGREFQTREREASQEYQTQEREASQNFQAQRDYAQHLNRQEEQKNQYRLSLQAERQMTQIIIDRAKETLGLSTEEAIKLQEWIKENRDVYDYLPMVFEGISTAVDVASLFIPGGKGFLDFFKGK